MANGATRIIDCPSMCGRKITFTVFKIKGLCRAMHAVAVLGWGQGAQAPQILPRPPKFLIGSVVHCFYQKDSEALKYA